MDEVGKNIKADPNALEKSNITGKQSVDLSSNEIIISSTGDDIKVQDKQHRKNSRQQQNNNQNPSNTPSHETKPKIRKYYIDELGFYRHLDPDQKQYVCSNLSSSKYSGNDYTNDNNNFNRSGANNNDNKLPLSRGDGGYEVCITAIRHDLGISHFDKTDNYEEWKKGWDDFMRSKLTKKEPVTINRDLTNRVRSGIPHDYRCKVWSAIIRMRTRKIREEVGDNIYEKLIQNYVSRIEIPDYVSDNNNNSSTITNEKSNCNKRSSYINSIKQRDTNGNNQTTRSSPFQEQFIEKCFKQIELDLLRTLPNNRHFENPNSIGIQRVRRVLRAYACFNPTVGYCQGMNRLAAMALLVLPEEEAFWCLVAIIQCIMPKDYYLKPWLAQVDCCVLKDLIEKKMPKLHKHLVKNDIDLTLFSWFFTIFVDGFRPELMLRIWDCFLLEGDKVLFRFALSILYIYQDDLLEMNDFSTISSHLARLVSTRSLDMEHLFESKYCYYRSVSDEFNLVSI